MRRLHGKRGLLFEFLGTILITVLIGGAAIVSTVAARQPTAGALERLDRNEATDRDMQNLQEATKNTKKELEILTAGGNLIGPGGPLPSAGWQGYAEGVVKPVTDDLIDRAGKSPLLTDNPLPPLPASAELYPGTWKEEDLTRGGSKSVKISQEGGTLTMEAGGHIFIGRKSGTTYTFTRYMRSPKDFVFDMGQTAPPKVVQEASKLGLKIQYVMNMVSANELRGQRQGYMLEWDGDKLTKYRNESPDGKRADVVWRKI